MNYSHYTFTATIHTQNMSRMAYFKLKEACMGLFFEEKDSRRSSKYWTRCKVSQYENADPSSTDGLVRFVIWDANSVRRLRAIAGKLTELCASDFKGLVTGIEWTHKRIG